MSAQVPVTRSIQFDASGIDKLPRTVNMFRGDVIYPHELVKLPGKDGRDDLAVTLKAEYQSNVQVAVRSSNLDAPTGILGLGWSLPLEWISASSEGALSLAAQSYVYTADGSSSALIPDSAQWQRATLPAAAAGTLPSSGSATVSSAVVSAFAAAGLVLDKTSTVTVDGSGWMIADDVNQRLFQIQSSGDTTVVLDGGFSFQLESYSFWRISYYAPYERWEIITDSGEIRSYGGVNGTTSDGFAQSIGNSVQWSVKWVDWTVGQNNSAQPPAEANWYGPSSASQSDTNQSVQAQYATGWYLASRRDRWGSQASYQYNEFTRDSDGCLGCNAEQLVGGGKGSLPYTKAIYLTSILDAFNVLVTLAYDYKDYTAAAQEYVDPHKVLNAADASATAPDDLTTPNSYQDRYECLYLTGLTVTAPGGALLKSLAFAYSPPAEVWTQSPSFGPAGAKRLLTSITQTNADGVSLPPYLFTYDQTQSATANCGALETLTFPEGAVATWTYNCVSLPICDHQVQVDAPSTDAMPFIWYGQDCVAVLWLSSDYSTATVYIYTWVGRWVQSSSWGGGTGQVYSDPSNPIQPSAVQGAVNSTSIAIALPTGSQTQVLLFGRNPAIPAAWALNSPTATVTGTIASLAAGANFVVVAQSEDGENTLTRWTWNWQDPVSPWTMTTNPDGDYGASPFLNVIAGQEYYLTAWQPQPGQTNVSITWIDSGCNWTVGDTATLDESTALNPGRNMYWAAGPSCAAFAFITSKSTTVQFSAVLLRWNATYSFVDQSTSAELCLTEFDSHAVEPPLTPVISGNTFVGIRQFLFRFDQGAWQSTSFVPAYQNPSQWLTFAYGEDVAVCVMNTEATVLSEIISYIPDNATASQSGFTTQTQINHALPSQDDIAAQGWPSISGDYLIAQNQLFFRGSLTDWSAATATSVQSIPVTYDIYTDQNGQETVTLNVPSTTVLNGGPGFVAYLGLDTSDPALSQAVVLTLSGGAVLQQQALAGSVYVAPDTTFPTGSASSPLGPMTLAAYPESTKGFAAPASLTLSRYTAQAITGPVQHFPVSSLVMTDGATGSPTVYSQTFYEFNAASAACDPSGTYVKYFQSASYPGAASLDGAALGRTAYLFQNGYQSAGTIAMLDGLPLQQVAFEGAFVGSCAWSADYQLPANGSVPASSALQTALAGLTTFGSTPTVTFEQIDGAYSSWILATDNADGATFLLDFNGDPNDPAALRLFTGGPVSSTTTTYDTFFSRVADPSAPQTTQVLHGGFTRPTQVVKRQDGVPLTTTFQYAPDGFAAPYTGGVAMRQRVVCNASGITEEHQEYTTYAAEVCSAAAAFNLMTSVAAVRTAITTGSTTVTATSHATVWDGWTCGNGLVLPAPMVQYSWIGAPDGSDDGVFTFGQQPSSLWMAASTVAAISDVGLVTETIDRGGMDVSTLYDASGLLPMASIANASFASGQAAFTSFESYEDLSAWSLEGAALAVDGRASIGCLSIPAGASAASGLSGLDPTRPLVLSAWVKTAAGTTIGSQAGWTLTVLVQGSTVGTVTLPFTATGGAWAFQSVPVPVPTLVAAGSKDVTLTVTAANDSTSTGPVLVDNVSLLPLATEFTARTYDPYSLMPFGTIDRSGKTSVILRDGFLRQIGSAAAGSPADALAPKTLAVPYLSRSGNAGSFQDADPNARLVLSPAGQGNYQTFRDESGWTAAWVSSAAETFTTVNGVLQHSGASATLTSATGLPDGDWALYIELAAGTGQTALALTDNLSIAIGSSVTFALASDWGWTLTADDSSVAPVASPGLPAASCLISRINGVLMLHVNGQLLFSTAAQAMGDAVLTTGANAIGFRNLSMLIQPRLSVVYSDGADQHVQQHLLGAGTYVVSQTIYDLRGKPIAITKPALGLFGSGSSLPMPAYRTGLVDLGSFLAGLGGSAVMTGDVADWYDGTNQNASDDGGYPYQRRVYEAAPLARVVELGLPGAANAVINLDSSAPSSRPTQQFTYTNSAVTSLSSVSLPASGTDGPNYLVTIETSPRKQTRYVVADAMVRQIGQIAFNGGVAAPSMNMTTVGNGVLQMSRTQPDYYALDEETLQWSQTINAIGQVLVTSSCDDGTTTHIYDSAGNLRFAQDAMGAVDGYFTYVIYDGMRRAVSMGTVGADYWSQAASQADTAGWPENADTGFTRLRSWTWDGDGSDPAAIGEIVSQTASTAAGSVITTITDTFKWYAFKKIKSWIVDVTSGGSSLGSWTTGFAYDMQGRLRQLDYPSVKGLGFKSALYSYDCHGRVASVTDASGVPFASYATDAMGLPVSVSYGVDAVASQAMTRDPLGRVTATSVKTEAVSYSLAEQYTIDGMVSSLSESILPSASGFDADVTYSYDDMNQLSSASDTQVLRSLGVSFLSGSTVSQNGNIQSLSAGGAASVDFSYAATSNQITAMQPLGGDSISCTYDANGSLTQRGSGDSALSIDYVPGLRLPATITAGGTTLSFGYGADGQRVLKQASDDQPDLRINAGLPGPILTIAADGTAKAWVYAQGSMIAVTTGGARYAIVTDRQASPRLVIDSSGALAAAYGTNSLGLPTCVEETVTGIVPFLLSGNEFDPETGLYDFRARIYDPSIGRFLSTDPQGEWPSPYSYVGNHFTVLTDPSGQLSTIGGAFLDVLLLAVFFATLGAGSAAEEVFVAELAEAETNREVAYAVVKNMAAQAVTQGIGSGAMKGLTCSLMTPYSDFNADTFWSQVGAGALGGAAGGTVAGFLGMYFDDAATLLNSNKAAQRAVEGGGAEGGQIVTAPVGGKPLRNMLSSLKVGIPSGFANTTVYWAVYGRKQDTDIGAQLLSSFMTSVVSAVGGSYASFVFRRALPLFNTAGRIGVAAVSTTGALATTFGLINKNFATAPQQPGSPSS